MLFIDQLPLVSILTPSYNSADFIEETVQSVKSQDYPNIEHIVVDGGSTDGTLEILNGYPNVKWLSEPDRGQSDALNKAFALSQGDIIGWLNADDLYEPGAVTQVVSYLVRYPAAKVVYGRCTFFDPDGTTTEVGRGPFDKMKLLEPWRGFHGACQPSVFYRREAISQIGGWATDLHYCMDYDLLLRASEFYTFDYIDANLSRFRRHDGQKGAQPWHRFVRELVISVERYWRHRDLVRYIRYRPQVRHFYALALLEQLISSHPDHADPTPHYLWQAVLTAPSVLAYSWVRRRCMKELLGSRLTAKIQKMLRSKRDSECV